MELPAGSWLPVQRCSLHRPNIVERPQAATRAGLRGDVTAQAPWLASASAASASAASSMRRRKADSSRVARCDGARSAPPGSRPLRPCESAARASALGEKLQSLRHAAERALQLDPPQHTWLPEGCEDAPPEILGKLVQMTAGAGMFPGDDEVDKLWIEMDAAARAPERRGEELPQWSHERLRREGSSSGTETGPGSASLADFLSRCEAVREALRRGLWTEIPDSADPELLEVYVTHLTNDDYVVGAEILAASLAATGTSRPLVALVTDGLSEGAKQALRDAGWMLVEVGLIGHEGVDSPQARGFFSKIWLWALPFHKVVYIDTDILVLRNLDHVFESYGHFELAAAADSQPHMDGEMISQTGFLVLRPCPERFSELWVLCSGSGRPMKLDDWKHFEQGFFTIYFDGGEELIDHGGGCALGWHELKPEYNFTVRYCKRPLFDGLHPGNAAVVHFACAKPWDWAQKNFSPAPYVKLYLEFAKAAGISWKTVECSADRARDRVNQEKMREIQARGGLSS